MARANDSERYELADAFAAEVLTENKPMQAVINKSNCKVSSHFTGNVYSYQMEFE